MTMGGKTLEVRIKDKKTAFDTNIYIYGKKPLHTNIIHFHLYRDKVEEEWTPYWAATIIKTETDVLDYTIKYPTLYLWVNSSGNDLGNPYEGRFSKAIPSASPNVSIINSSTQLSDIPIIFTSGKAECEYRYNYFMDFHPLEVGENGTIEGYLKCPLPNGSFKNLYFVLKCTPYAAFLSGIEESSPTGIYKTYFCEVPKTIELYGIKYFETADIVENGLTVRGIQENSRYNDNNIDISLTDCQIINEGESTYPKAKVLIECNLTLKNRIEDGKNSQERFHIAPISTNDYYNSIGIALLDSYWIDNNNETSIDGNKYYHDYTMENTPENAVTAFMYIRHAVVNWYEYKGEDDFYLSSNEKLTEEVIEMSKPVLLQSSLKGGTLTYTPGKTFLRLGESSSASYNVIQLNFENIQFNAGKSEITGAIVTYPGSLYKDPKGEQYTGYKGGIIMNFTIKKKQ